MSAGIPNEERTTKMAVGRTRREKTEIARRSKSHVAIPGVCRKQKNASFAFVQRTRDHEGERETNSEKKFEGEAEKIGGTLYVS